MAVGRVGADHHDHVGGVDRLEVLRAGRGAEGLLQAVAGRRVADPGAGVDVVVAERGPHHLLDDVDLLVGAARRGDAADGAPAVLGLDLAEPAGGEGDRLVPGDDDATRRRWTRGPSARDAVGVGGVAPREAALHAASAPRWRRRPSSGTIRTSSSPLQLGLERAADAAVGAGGLDAAGGHAELDDRLLLQRRRRAGLHAGAARHALGVHERRRPPRRPSSRSRARRW